MTTDDDRTVRLATDVPPPWSSPGRGTRRHRTRQAHRHDAGRARSDPQQSRCRDAARVATLHEIETTRTIGAVVRAIRNRYDMKHFSYVAARYGAEPEKDPFVRSTYSPVWLGRYLLKQYWRIDPIMREGFARTVPFDWADVDRTRPEVEAFFRDARAHRVGQNGLLLPLTNAHNQRGILSISSDLAGEAWESYKRDNLADFIELGAALHRRALRDIFGDTPPPPRLSPREKEMLRWVSEGKEVPDIAIITGLSEHTVRTYLKSGRLKLDCGTMPQAVVKAERLSLLRD